MTSSDGVSRHTGMYSDARSSMSSRPSASASPTSVLATDLVIENTGCGAAGSVPCQYHSPTSRPRRTTAKHDEPVRPACSTFPASASASNPISSGSARAHDRPG